GRPPTGKIRVPTRADTSGEASRRWSTRSSTSSAMASPPFANEALGDTVINRRRMIGKQHPPRTRFHVPQFEPAKRTNRHLRLRCPLCVVDGGIDTQQLVPSPQQEHCSSSRHG